MGKKEKGSSGKKHPVLKAFLIILLILLLLLAAAVWFIWSKLDLLQYDIGVVETAGIKETSGATEPEPEPEEEQELVIDISGLELMETAPAISEGEIVGDDQIFNILILGTDERTKDFSTNARSDCMILASINMKDNSIKLISMERGMGVPVLEGQYKGKYDWMTHMFRYGGADLVMKTVEHCFKVEVDHYVRFNFTAVTEVVDAVGGIDVELSSAEANKLSYMQEGIHTGVSHLYGEAALKFARLRSIDSDWQRVKRQRKVIIGVVDALKGSNLKELNSFVDSVLPLIQTNLTKLEIAELMLYAPNLLNASFDQMTIPKSGTYGGMKGMGGRSLYAVDFDANAEILHEFIYGEE